ncbi:hypothetical protein LTR17_023717 [Elasticomyces elasticus]|nr:hypothetical protein LTR17_023717 [Elasticomyces elasticus]
MATGPCPLLDLPPELRNTLWELVLADDDPGKGRFVHITSQGSIAVPAILRTNEQTRRETLPMWYGNAHFITFVRDAADVQSCPSRLALIGNLAARHIRHIKVRMRFFVGLPNCYTDIDLDLGAVEAATVVQARRLYNSARFPERIEQHLSGLAPSAFIFSSLPSGSTLTYLILDLSFTVLHLQHHNIQQTLHNIEYASTFMITAEMAIKRCPLLTLPPELRNNIYDMVFEEDHRHHPYININKNGHAINMHALLHVNKQVRSETMGIWHNINTFTLYNLTPDSGVTQCNLWVDRIGASNLRCVQHIAICILLPLTTGGHSAQIFIIDIDLRAHTAEDAVHWRSPGANKRRPEPLAFENFRQQMYTAVNSWQLRTVKHSGTGEWRELLRAVLAVQKDCWTCVIEPVDDQEV